MLHVRYSQEALDGLDKIGHVAAKRIKDKITSYAANPAAYANMVKRLKGSVYLRLRVGDYRVVFTKEGVIVEIIKIDHRRDIYH